MKDPATLLPRSVRVGIAEGREKATVRTIRDRPPRELSDPSGTPQEAMDRFARAFRLPTSSEIETDVTQRNAAAEELDLKAREAREKSRCPCFVEDGRKSPVRVCDRPAVLEEYCSEHYCKEVLKVIKHPHGKGVLNKYRPFSVNRLPLYEMSQKHHELLKSLPINTPYEECIGLMQAADKRNRLTAIPDR